MLQVEVTNMIKPKAGQKTEAKNNNFCKEMFDLIILLNRIFSQQTFVYAASGKAQV